MPGWPVTGLTILVRSAASRPVSRSFAVFDLYENIAPDDLADGEIAVLDRLRNVVAVGRLAEIGDVVGGDAGVFQRAPFHLDLVGKLERARRRRQADLERRAVAREHLAP